MQLRYLSFSKKNGVPTFITDQIDSGDKVTQMEVKVVWSLIDLALHSNMKEDVTPIGCFAGLRLFDENWIVGMGQAAERIWPSPRQCVCVDIKKFEPGVLPFLGLYLWITGGLQKAGTSLGERVLILGAGLFGQLATQFVRLAGATDIMVIDFRKCRETWALMNGADYFMTIYEAEENKEKQIKFDLMVDTLGNSELMNEGLSFLKPGSRALLLAGTYPLSDFNFYAPAHTRSLTLYGGEIPSDYGQTLEYIKYLLRNRKLRIDKLSIKKITAPKEYSIDNEEVGGLLIHWNNF